MSQSLVQIYVHIVFSTKSRDAFLRDPALRGEMHAYLGGMCRNMKSPSIAIGGTEDHVHILCRPSKSVAVENLVRDLKRDSSKWAKTKGEGDELKRFFWQHGYGAFSVSPAHANALRQYIENQVAHHRKESFQDEFRRLLKKYGLSWDERYVWD